MSLNQISQLLMEAEKKAAFDRGVLVGFGVSFVTFILLSLIIYCLL